LAFSHFCLFGDVKRQLTGQSFETREEFWEAIQDIWNDFNSAMWQSVFEDWMTTLRRYIQLKGIILSKVWYHYFIELSFGHGFEMLQGRRDILECSGKFNRCFWTFVARHMSSRRV
jgi:hypothetical protein